MNLLYFLVKLLQLWTKPFGMSTGLEYNPGLHAEIKELNQLARIVGKHDRLIMSHMRNEDDDQLEVSIAELLSLIIESKATVF